MVPFESVTGLANKLVWLQVHAQSNGNYVLEVTADEDISPSSLSYSDRSNITVTLRGIGANRTVSLSSNGSLFTVGGGVTLVLDNNITLRGRSDNHLSLVMVNSGGTLIMNDGSCITGNTADDCPGGGVSVWGGTFTMNGGEISSNTASFEGGGVYMNRGTFTKTGGGTITGYASDTVNGNVVKNSSGTVLNDRGHAVYVNSDPVKRRETTAGPGVNMDSRVDGSAGGWDNWQPPSVAVAGFGTAQASSK